MTYTIDQVRESVLWTLNDYAEDNESGYTLEDMSRSDLPAIFWPQAVEVLNHLGVSDPEDRVSWMNQPFFTVSDLFALANVEGFVTLQCGMCGEDKSSARPENWDSFSGCLNFPTIDITLEPLGDTETLCEDCIGKLRSMMHSCGA